MSALMKAIAFMAILIALTGCTRVDPISSEPNRDGVTLMDAKAGSGRRIICALDRTDSCNTRKASVIVSDLSTMANLFSEWTGDHMISIYVRGGVVDRCEPELARYKVRIRPYQLPQPDTDRNYLPTADEMEAAKLTEICPNYASAE